MVTYPEPAPPVHLPAAVPLGGEVDGVGQRHAQHAPRPEEGEVGGPGRGLHLQREVGSVGDIGRMLDIRIILEHNLQKMLANVQL